MTKEYIAKNIAGEITLSAEWQNSMRKWREIFGVSQINLARHLDMSPSVISDYESGRRKSPGIGFVRRVVDGLIDIDLEEGGDVIKKLALKPETEAILDMREFLNPIDAEIMIKKLRGKTIANKNLTNRKLWGYTVIDSIKAILEMSEIDFPRIYGSTTQRALIFTKVKMGRSPMIALKVTQPKPSMVIFHGLEPKSVDKLAVKIAKMENIPLVVSTLESEDELMEKLRLIET
ncbi:MAG: helix-turn-helix domain-containing protein [Candidatus Altiarchaeota archaeon]